MFNWFNFLSYAIITAATPGPNNIMGMTNAGHNGFKKSFPFCLGVFAGISCLLYITLIFCSALSAIIPKIEFPMLIIGAAYMLYLAYKIFRSSEVSEESESKTGFWAGFVLQFLNPKIYIFCIMTLEAYVLPSYSGQWGMLVFLFVPILALISFTSIVSWTLFGSVFKVLFSKYAKITNTVMALLLVYCAVSLFI